MDWFLYEVPPFLTSHYRRRGFPRRARTINSAGLPCNWRRGESNDPGLLPFASPPSSRTDREILTQQSASCCKTGRRGVSLGRTHYRTNYAAGALYYWRPKNCRQKERRCEGSCCFSGVIPLAFTDAAPQASAGVVG